MTPAGLDTKNDYAGEDHQQFNRPNDWKERGSRHLLILHGRDYNLTSFGWNPGFNELSMKMNWRTGESVYMQKAFINREKELLQAACNAKKSRCPQHDTSVMSIGKISRSYEQKLQNDSTGIYAWIGMRVELCHEISIHNTAVYCVFLSYKFLYLSINITVFPQIFKLLTSRNFWRSSFFKISSWNFDMAYATGYQNEPPVPYRSQPSCNEKCYAQPCSKNSICTELMYWLLFVNLCSLETPEVF